MENRSVNQSDILNRLVRAVILIIVSLLLSIVSVSFAMHHMRLQFEEEYKAISDNKVKQVCEIVKMTVNGDEVIADPGVAAQKYGDVFSLMLAQTSEVNFTEESYAMFLYSEGELQLLLSNNTDNPNNFEVATREISSWLSADNSITTIGGINQESVLVPIADSTGKCVAVFEYRCNFDKLSSMGSSLENRVLTAVLITVATGVFCFIIQLLIPKLIKKTTKGGQRL